MAMFKRAAIETLCSSVCSGGTPKSSVAAYYDGGIPWLNTKEVNFNRIYSTERTISQQGLDNSSAKWIPTNTVVVAMYGATAGRCAIAGIPMTTNQACCNLVINPALADYRFVYYALCLGYVRLASSANGGAQQNLNAQMVKQFDIACPPLSTQRKIAAVLSSLDDKIETNNAICRNLEEQADALFKAWFVDFSFHASGKWRDSEMGAIPDGWIVHHMDDFFDIRTGKKDANVAGASGKYPFFSCAQDILWTDEYSFEGNAILVAGNGDFNVKRYVGQFEAYQRTYVLIPDKPLLSGILYYAIKAGLKDITSEARGSVIKFITKGSIAKFTIALPADVEKWSVTSALNNINTQIDLLTEESRKLATLRDTLLPRLMSGEIDVDKVQL